MVCSVKHGSHVSYLTSLDLTVSEVEPYSYVNFSFHASINTHKF
uniref:Uncharacterized protein n=1 Tax=Arundo donax TaxID=35708 RepID=A0A0A9A755_ARUDO